VDNKKKVGVLGAGSWGTAAAIHLQKKGHEIKLWEYYEENVNMMNKTGKNPLLPGIAIPDSINITGDLDDALDSVDLVIVVVPSHAVRELLEKVQDKIDSSTIIINLAKGLEKETMMRMSEVIQDVLNHPGEKIVTLHGPSHAEEVAREIPTAVVSASKSLESAEKVQQLFISENFRVYTNPDIIGVEIGGAVKNVIAIASGICDGLGLGDNSRAALITRGLMEITRLGVKLGAKEETFSGLSGVGDLLVTCDSEHSRNRHLGEEIGKGRKVQEILDGMTMVAEGVKTCETVKQLSTENDVLMPISNQVYKILYEDKDPAQGLKDLMTRQPVRERHSIPGE